MQNSKYNRFLMRLKQSDSVEIAEMYNGEKTYLCHTRKNIT
jgi:hypothetical protein